MRLPLAVTLLGYLGLIPFFTGPAWIVFSPETVPPRLDALWITWCTLLAAFLAGTLWGFALPALQGPAGVAATLLASALMLFTWLSTLLPTDAHLWALGVNYLLLLAVEIWRERTLDTLPGYFRLRATLTVGATIAIGWRYTLI